MDGLYDLVSDGKYFKSQGERKIAEFLDSYRINYQYEPSLIVDDGKYKRIWYPDFKLTDYDIFVEYLGIENNPVYDERSLHKFDVYKKMGLYVIPVYPSNLKGDYRNYILDKIHTGLYSKLSNLEGKIKQYNYRNSSHSSFGSKKSSSGYK